MNILGISAFYHDSAAGVVGAGGEVAAAQEERFDRVKGSPVFPLQAVNACLGQTGQTTLDVDEVAFYEKPFQKFERVLVDHVRSFPFSFPAFLRTVPSWLSERLVLPDRLKKDLALKKPVLFVPHHLAHAGSAFLASPFDEAAILTVDGVGEWTTTAWGVGRGSSIDLRGEVRYPDSLGLLYTAVTTWLGFDANRGEGTTMALAGLGQPAYLDRFRSLLGLRSDGSFRLDPRYFRFSRGGVMFSPAFVEEFGPARAKGEPLADVHRDVAASLQAVLEEALLAMARHVRQETGCKDLCLAGGVALNCAANGRLLDESGFDRIFVPPAAGDAGAALGAALVVRASHRLPRIAPMADAFLGPDYPVSRMRRALSAAGLEVQELSEPVLLERVARRLAEGAVIGWFEGRMELGPRALGHRSILADPRDPAMKDRLNARVKHREPFRPYGASVLASRAGEWFERATPSPFMLFATRVRPDRRARIPSALHVDGTCRHQTLTEEANGRTFRLVQEFDRLTGVPMVLNTSFNDRGEPIVCTPEDAVSCTSRIGLDALVLGPFYCERRPGAPAASGG